MKREIKFRVWDKHDNSMKRVISIREDSVDVPLQRFPFMECILDYELMQYTGLKDKNGVEIYEGDIVEYDGFTRAMVVFKSGCFMGYDGFASNSDEAYLLLEEDSNPFDGDEFEIEVIGNIYENPGLLK